MKLKTLNVFFFSLFFCVNVLAVENSSHQYNFFTGNFDFSDDKQ
jgi:lipid A 3-O-deacylase